MDLSTDPESITEDDRQLAEILEEAELPSLLPALAYATGDLSLVSEDLRPPPLVSAIVLPQAGMSENAQKRARSLALDVLRRWRDSGIGEMRPPDPSALRHMMEFVTGEVTDDYLSLMTYELGLSADGGSPGWTKDALAPNRAFTVAVIGAGMSGLVMCHRLAQAGVPFVVFERNADVGGVWLENTYPGCRLDTSNFNYSYSFAQKQDWPQQYSRQDTILEYLGSVADLLAIRPHIRFEHEVLRATYDEASADWVLGIRGPDGIEAETRVQALVSAMGQLNTPSYPDIPGRDRFAGQWWHTARWDHSVDLRGKRVAVIGTGASAFQVIPGIADQVGQLHVFQRNPPYVIPTPTYLEDIPPGRRWLFDHVPHYHRWFRFYQFWTSVEGRRPFSQVDPAWHHDISISQLNETLRATLVAHIQGQFEDRLDLREKVVPNYPPYAKRMLRDSGAWSTTLKQPHVSLITEAIAEITEAGIRTVDGTEHQVDVIIYGTGFAARDFLAPVVVTGRGGVELHAQWNGEPRAYLGVTIPGFPNLFCLYGPNTNLVVNGSIFLFSECAAHYVSECIGTILAKGARAMDCREQPFDAYNQRIDAANALMAWGVPGVTNWYKNARGRVTQNWPLTTLEYWELTRAPADDDYDYL